MTADRPLAAVLSPIPWHGLWTSRHELAGALGRRGWHVLFFDPPANRARRVARSAPRRPGGPPPAGVEVLTPPAYLPYGWARGLGAAGRAVVDLNAARYARYVAGAVATATGAGRGRRPGGGVDLLINSFMPVLGYRVDREVAARVRVYHRADELRQFPSWCEQYSRLEEAVARHADVVACVSEPVRAGISHVRPDAVVVPNGVDPSRFDGAVPDQRLAGLDRPVAVMVGVFDARVDPDLLAAVAGASRLVMAGRLEGVAVPPGARHLGEVDPSEVPGILAAADVGVVCYRTDWAGDVLKIYEYLAAGLPVVTSDLPGLGGLRPEVTVAAGPAAFAAAVLSEAAGRDPAGTAHRREVAGANSWDRRLDRLLALAGRQGLEV